jgi:hypothetical protein
MKPVFLRKGRVDQLKDPDLELTLMKEVTSLVLVDDDNVLPTCALRVWFVDDFVKLVAHCCLRNRRSITLIAGKSQDGRQLEPNLNLKKAGSIAGLL